VACIAYNDVAFRALFPAYANVSQYATVALQSYWNNATAYISNRNGGYYTGGMSLPQQTQALNLMTAHLVFLASLIASGNTPGVMTGATIDKISVTLEPPPSSNNWQYWLNQSPYGQQLLALLSVASVGGFYASSAVPGRAGFQFGNGW
jgi:hypothetical protein